MDENQKAGINLIVLIFFEVISLFKINLLKLIMPIVTNPVVYRDLYPKVQNGNEDIEGCGIGPALMCWLDTGGKSQPVYRTCCRKTVFYVLHKERGKYSLKPIEVHEYDQITVMI